MEMVDQANKNPEISVDASWRANLPLCLNCKNPFSKKRKDQKFCCPECKKQFYKTAYELGVKLYTLQTQEVIAMVKEKKEVQVIQEETKEEKPEVQVIQEETKEEKPEVQVIQEETKEEKPEVQVIQEETKEEKPEVQKAEEAKPKVENKERLFTSNLKHNLTDEEKQNLGSDLADAIARKAEAESELKSFQTQIKARIAADDATILSCSEKIRKGYEFRNIECKEIKDFEADKLFQIRLDTGKIIFERTLENHERQKELPLENASTEEDNVNNTEGDEDEMTDQTNYDSGAVMMQDV
jgi:transposase-like protein